MVQLAGSDLDEVLTLKQVARLLGMSLDTIRRAIKAGKLRGFRLNEKGHFRIRRSSIEQYLRS